MKTIQIKLFAIAMIIIPILVVTGLNTNAVSAVSNTQDDVAALYKKKTCFACHKADASKFFDATKTDEELTEIVLKGKKGEKPPYMPAYEEKGITSEQAAALVAHMKKLKEPGN